MKNYKYILIVLLMVSFAGEVQAQSGSLSKKEQKKMLREERKREAEEQEAMILALSKTMISSARFVLEADMIFSRQGEAIPVSSGINFVLVDSLYGIIQTGNSYSIGGNGLGGSTVEGQVRNYNIRENEKRKTTTVSFDLSSTFGSYSVSISTGGTGHASANITGGLMRGNLRMSGQMVPVQTSRVYKGNSF